MRPTVSYMKIATPAETKSKFFGFMDINLTSLLHQSNYIKNGERK